MKRLLYFSLLVFIGMVCLQSPAAAQDGIRMYINGVEKFADPAPFIDTQSGRTYVPVRFVAESLGAEVSYVEAEKMVVVKSVSGKTICLFLNSTRATIDNAAVTLDAEAKVVNSRTMVPLRFVAENLDLVVAWDQNTQTITLTSQAAAPPASQAQTIDPVVLPDGSIIRVNLLDGWRYTEGVPSRGILFALDHESGAFVRVTLGEFTAQTDKEEYLNSIRENLKTLPANLLEEDEQDDAYLVSYTQSAYNIDWKVTDMYFYSEDDNGMLEGLLLIITLARPADLEQSVVDQLNEDFDQLLIFE